MKLLNVLPYILFFSCISVINAQRISSKDSIKIQEAYKNHVVKDKKLRAKFWRSMHDSIQHFEHMNAIYLENLSMYNVLESYQLEYQKGSHWSDLKGDILVDLYKFSIRSDQTDVAKQYKSLVLGLDYILLRDKIKILLEYNRYVFAATLNNEIVLNTSYQISQYLKQGNYPKLEISHLFFMVRFYRQTNNLDYAEEVLEQTRKKVFGNNYPIYKEIYYKHSLELLMAKKKYSDLKNLLPAYKNHTKRISLNYDLALIHFWGFNDIPMAKKHLQLLKDTYGGQNFRSDFTLLEAEIALAEQDYIRVLSLINQAESQNFATSRYFKNESHIEGARLRALAYEGLNNPMKALFYQKEFKRREDSIRSLEKEMQFFQANFHLKKDKELQQLTEANLKQELASEQSQKQARLYIFGLIILMFLGIAGVYYFKTKKNLQTRLALENARHMAHMKNNLIENLSHEFRTPLTIILGYLDLIKQRTTHPEKISQYAKTAITNGNRLIQGLNDLLSLLRIDTEKTNIKSLKKSDNLGAFISNLVEGFATVAQMNDVKLFYQSNLLSNQTTIEFEYDHLTKILNNLISNAIKFSKSRGSVYVSSILTKKNLEICVKDDGIGISKSELSKIFDRFYQSEKHSHSGGFGIGLSLVKSLIEFLHGTIDVKSKKDTGTQFKVSIPLVLENRDLYIQTTSEYIELTETLLFDEHPSTKKNSNLPKVLILEDHFEMSLFFKELLAPYLQCTWVRHGKAALKKLEQEQFDLIISDLKMPVMDGFEFKAALNRLIDHRNTPYLMVSASPIDFKVEERTQLKIDEYIMKPFSDRELISRVRLLLKKKLYKKQVLQLDKGEAVQFEGNFSEFMEKVNTVILDNLHNSEFNVKKLASSCGYSERHFSRLLQSKTGMTPVKIILEIKLLKAYEMLKSGKRQTIAEVIYESGFNDRSYFYRAFSKRFGIKPSELHGISSLQSIGMN